MPTKKTEAVLDIVKEPVQSSHSGEPERVLRKKASEVRHADIASPRIRKLIEDMKKTLSHTPDGVGLAAPQVGESLRIFIVSDEAEEIDRADARHKKTGPDGEPPYAKRPWHYYVFINPVVKKISRAMREDAEGCLSVPKKYGIVMRHEKLTVEAYDEHGKKITRGASKFFARVMQHELDHLEGVLFVDKVKKFIKTDN